MRSAARRVALIAALSLAGCAPQGPRFAAADGRRRAVVFLVDGLDATVLDAMLEAGELPVIEREFVRGGLRVRHAVNALPAVTYANVATLLTGVWPARHGILGNRWFDPRTRRARDYGYAGTFRAVNDDLRAATIFELLVPEPTAAVQLHTRRGATKIIDFSIANGIDWALGRYERVNARAAEALPRLDRFARRVGLWPRLVVFYFPGVDEIGHRFGPESPRYRRSIRRVDATIGRVLDGLRQRGMDENCYRVLVSDHGMVATPASKRFDLVGWLARRTGLRVRPVRGALADPLARRRRIRNADIVIAADAGRRAHLHLLRAGSEWAGTTSRRGEGGREKHGGQTPSSGPAKRTAPRHLLAFADSRGRQSPTTTSIFLLRSSLLELPTVDLVCLRRCDGCVEIRSRRGTAVVTRRLLDGRREYRMQVLTPRDPLGYDAGPHAAELLDGRWHSSRTWLERTAATQRPDFVPQIVELFDSPRAGDLIVFAADGWTLRREGPGSHGGAGRRDRIVPLMFAGPGIAPGSTLPAARTSDLVPTLLSLLGAKTPPRASFDGIVLPLIRHNTPAD